MADETEESESEWEETFARWVKRIMIAAGVWVAVTSALVRWAASNATEQEATGRIVAVGDVPTEVRRTTTGDTVRLNRMADEVKIVLDGRDEAIEYSRGKPSKLSDLVEGDRVRVRYREGTALFFWSHLRVLDVQKLPATAIRAP